MRNAVKIDGTTGLALVTEDAMAEEAQSEVTQSRVIEEWENIAREAGRAINRSVCVRSAQRYAAPNRENRLPVYFFPNGTVYLLRSHLALWASAWLDPIPVGAVPAPVKRAPRIAA